MYFPTEEQVKKLLDLTTRATQVAEDAVKHINNLKEENERIRKEMEFYKAWCAIFTDTDGDLDRMVRLCKTKMKELGYDCHNISG